MELSELLQQNRRKVGLTQEKVATMLSVNPETVSDWESGKRFPMLSSLVKLSHLYGMSLDEVIETDSKIIDYITEQVRTSRKRYLMNILLTGILLVFSFSVAITSLNAHFNSEKNSEGISANDLYDRTFELVDDPDQEQKQAILTFSKNDLHVLRDFEEGLITPDMSQNEINEHKAVWQKNGWKYIDKQYKNIRVTLRGNDYIVDGLGYHEKFTRLKGGLLKDGRGIIYKEVK